MEKSNFFYLFGALLFLLIMLPLAHDLGMHDARGVRAIIYSVTLLVGVWSLKGGGRFFAVGIMLALVGVALNVVSVEFEWPIIRRASNITLIGFLLVAISYSLKQVIFGTQMNANRLVGAICVFLLLGVIWSLAYSLLEQFVPNSFRGFSPGFGPGSDSGWLYFSFVTLTTLGYGDITPVTAMARSLSYMQAVAGQFYVAVLVAGLVSAYISDLRDK